MRHFPKYKYDIYHEIYPVYYRKYINVSKMEILRQISYHGNKNAINIKKISIKNISFQLRIRTVANIYWLPQSSYSKKIQDEMYDITSRFT